MKILAIDTSCDETASAVTDNTKVISNIVWSQASLHARWGGVVPSLAQRMHNERIDWVINKAIKNSGLKMQNLDAIAVTIGPGLSIALGVGIDRAKKLALKYKKPLIAVNHVEAHILSPLAKPKKLKNSSKVKNQTQVYPIKFPAYGLCVSGKNTEFVLIKKIGEYNILANRVDDALGEAIDKAGRMLGLGYPAGYVLEKFARLGDPRKFNLPIPLVGQEKRQIFSYSGLKTSFYRLIQSSTPENKQDVYDLAATFQDTAFKHVERVLSYYFTNHISVSIHNLFLGGGVAANIELRKRIRHLGTKFGIKIHIPYSQKLLGDNAAMIGVAAYLNPKIVEISKIDRDPNLTI